MLGKIVDISFIMDMQTSLDLMHILSDPWRGLHMCLTADLINFSHSFSGTDLKYFITSICVTIETALANQNQASDVCKA